jgi:hypothetical protein
MKFIPVSWAEQELLPINFPQQNYMRTMFFGFFFWEWPVAQW